MSAAGGSSSNALALAPPATPTRTVGHARRASELDGATPEQRPTQALRRAITLDFGGVNTSGGAGLGALDRNQDAHPAGANILKSYVYQGSKPNMGASMILITKIGSATTRLALPKVRRRSARPRGSVRLYPHAAPRRSWRTCSSSARTWLRIRSPPESMWHIYKTTADRAAVLGGRSPCSPCERNCALTKLHYRLAASPNCARCNGEPACTDFCEIF